MVDLRGRRLIAVKRDEINTRWIHRETGAEARIVEIRSEFVVIVVDNNPALPRTFAPLGAATFQVHKATFEREFIRRA
ncbi:MAG TPA: hypothetical protein VGJ62_13690 [Gemmatimonadaceae bacterium]